MEELIELLEEIKEDVDFANTEDLIDGKYLNSLDVLQIIAALNDEYDIEIPASDIIPKNFNSVKAMMEMIQRLEDE